MDFGERNRALFQHFLKSNPGVLCKITPVLPESSKQRRFYHGAVLPLWAYLDGKDYRNSDVLADLHEVAKLEFNGHDVMVSGRHVKVGRSTKGGELGPYLERVIEYLMDSYGINPSVVLEPARYKEFIDTVFMEGKYDTYIDYLVELRLLKPYELRST